MSTSKLDGGDKKKIKIVQPKAADPGFGFFLETEDGTPFDSSLAITITIKDTTVNPVVIYKTEIQVTNEVFESRLPIIAPFGDQNWLNPSIEMKELPYEVKVEFLDAVVPYTSEATGNVWVTQGEFDISVEVTAGPQTALAHIIKGFRMLFGLD
ncbi:hypothetical protein [Lewinella cohaerens]|uniref:hypothetical protein n=1 Tax=Lewinella cohaerens TaxID=70995 RepID=UPI000374FC4E|nr:hypothetical protein [Lewinella cohaerens]